MATIRLMPSASAVSNANYVSISSADNMYTNTDSTTAGTFTHNRATTNSTYYGYLRGFNFTSIPSGATVSSFTVKIKASATGHTTSTSTNYYMSLCNGTTTISGTNASGRLSTTTNTFTFTTSSLSWNTIVNTYGSNFGIRIPLRRASSNTADVVSVYGAEIEVTYTLPTPVAVTGVSLDQNTASIEEGDTLQLTATISPSNATDQVVTWESNNTSVATVSSSGLVTTSGRGTATITVTTHDGGYTDTCVVTVTTPVTTEYVLASTLTPGNKYVVANGNTGSVYLMTNESGGSRQLVGVSATVTDGKLHLTGSTENRCAFDCIEYTSGNSITTTLKDSSNKYIYCDNSSGLRFYAPTTLDRFWHYNNTKFWQFKSSSSDGYSDTSSEYKYYLQVSNGNFTDNHVSTTSIEASTLPAIYLFTPAPPPTGTGTLYSKSSGSWVEYPTAYKKISGTWVLQADLSAVFDSEIRYVKGN